MQYLLMEKKVELRQLRYFLTIANKRHFTQAAEELNIAQPALSQQIQQLERELGVVLLERTSRRVRLTSAGEAFLARTERILNEVERAQAEMQEFAGLARGRVVIGTLQSLGEFRLPALLARFHKRYPGIEIVLREEATEQLLELLKMGQLDLTLIHVTDATLPRNLAKSQIVTETLLVEELVLVVAPGHALARHESIVLEELRDEPFVSFKPGSGLRQAIMQGSAAAGFTPHIIFETGDIGAIRALVAEGLGVSLLPRSVAEAPGREIAIIALNPPSLSRTVLLAWLADYYHSPAASAFLKFIRGDLRRHPWAGEKQEG